MKDVAGKTALLTGASTGIGPYIARRLHRERVRLVLSARSRTRLESLADELGGARVEVADLARAGEAERLAAKVPECDILVANAGVPGAGRLEGWTVAAIDEAIAVNLRAPIVLARLLTPAMAARGGGHVVLMASMSAHIAGAHTSIYNATKFGLRGFGLALRHELHGAGVGVSMISPTYVKEAGMYARHGAKGVAFAGEVSPEQVAGAVVRAIREDRREIEVAPVRFVVAARIQNLLPGIAERITRRAAGHPAHRGD
jgi:short-subunit dehydrogenase